MVRPGDVIPERLRRVAAEEDRAGVADPGRKLVRGLGLDLEMLGRDQVAFLFSLVLILRAAFAIIRAADPLTAPVDAITCAC